MSTETQRAEFDVLPELMKLADAYAQAFNQFGSGTYNPRTASERAFLENNLRAAFAQASQAAELAALKADIAEYVHIASEQATEIEALKDQLASIRKWATGWSEVPYDDPWKFAAQELLSSMDMHAAMQTKEAS